MRKKVMFLILFLLFVGMVVLLMMINNNIIFSRTKIKPYASVSVQFEYAGQLKNCQVTPLEATRIIKILDNRFEYKENYSCGFSASSAIIIDGVVFYIASDGCPILLDTSTNLYFRISKSAKHEISSIFAKYGGVVFWK